MSNNSLDKHKNIDTSYLPDIYMCYLLEDSKYREEILNKRVTRIFRPGDRTSVNHPTYLKSDSKNLSFIGIIKQYGSHQTKTLPIIEFKLPIRVIRRYAINIHKVTFMGAYSTLGNEDDLKKYFLEKYSLSLTENDYVTVYDIEYVD